MDWKVIRNIFSSYLKEQCGVDKQQKVLVALSGGADSIALLHLLLHEGIQVCAAHCNFTLRGEESDADEDFVTTECRKLGVELYVKRFDTTEYAKDKGISIEMAARDLRYSWFQELMISANADFLATGHHKDDSVETFFLNLLRGTGIKGLTGIKPRTDKLIRPMLGISRKEIELYCRENGIAFRVDASNMDSIYTRNKIRNEIIPLFKEINPSFNQTMEENIQRLAQVNQYFENSVSSIKEELIVEQDNKVLISLSHVTRFTDPELVLFEVLHPYGFNAAVVKEIVECISQGVSGKQFFSKDYRIIKDRFNLILLPIESKEEDGPFYINLDDDNLQKPVSISLLKDINAENYKIEKDSAVAQFDADLLSYPLTLRRWKQGDVFRPLGMKHFKKLSDFFIDIKLSIADKENAWLLLSGDDVIWVVGYRTDDRYKITSKTKKVAKFTLHQ
ncbi:tRNA lysidine(34) synthetase TilS [Labilibacter sediminis]|nr:tRNA lysidine(34) synthetase TilS [Labilibacter sediminis]